MKEAIEREARRVFGARAVASTLENGTRCSATAGVPDDAGGPALVVLGAPTPHDAERRLLQALRGTDSLGPKHSNFFERLFDALKVRLGGSH